MSETKINKGYEKFTVTFVAIVVTTSLFSAAPLGVKIVLLAALNLTTVTLGAQTCAALNLKVRRGRVKRRAKWAKAYMLGSLALVSGTTLLAWYWSYQYFQAASWISSATDRKACVILSWLLELTLTSVFWYWVAWPSFQRKRVRRLEEAKKFATVQYRRYKELEAQRAALRAADEARLHAEMYETRTTIPAESIKQALDSLREGRERFSGLSDEEAGIVKVIMQSQFGDDTCIEDVVSIPVEKYEVLRANQPAVDMAVASLRRDELHHTRRSGRKGKTVKFADLRRRRRQRQTGNLTQAQRLIKSQFRHSQTSDESAASQQISLAE